MDSNGRLKLKYKMFTQVRGIWQQLTKVVSGGEYLSVSPTASQWSYQISTPCPGSSNQFNITASGSWTLADNMNWCSQTPTSGTGNATITVSVSLNKSVGRSGTITVTQGGLTATHSVSQTATMEVC